MDARILDVLHHSPDDTASAVGNGVHIGLEGVLQKSIDQHRMPRSHPDRPGEVIAQRGLVVDDFHAPAAEHV